MSNIGYRLSLILKSIEIIEERMRNIRLPNDFVKDHDGVTLLDAISARLQSIGENVTKITRLDKNFFLIALETDPIPIIDFRNIISHEYELLDYQIIYEICTDHLPARKQKIQTFLSNSNEQPV